MTANRIKQKPPPSQGSLQGPVAESGMVHRPNNFGHCDYIDMLFGMKCFPDLVSLGVFRSAKDVSESMAVLQGVTRHGRNLNLKSKSDVLCLCIGDGCTPRTAVLACYLQGWTCVSIDPALSEEWSGCNPKDVVGLTGYRGTLAQFFDETDPSLICPSSSSSSSSRYQHLVLLCVHSHARFIGSVTIPRIRNRYDNVATTICSLPCCPKFRHKGDIGRGEPDISYDDDCVFSAMRKVEIWKIEQGYDDAGMILCGEIADSSASSMDHLTIDSPADLTPDVLAEMLRSCPLFSEHLPHDNSDGKNDLVQSISVDEIEEGVLSHVVRVNIEYLPRLSNDLLPDSLVIKFLRPDAPQHRMFLTEGTFYSSANDTLRRDVVPFQIPKAIYISSNCIALEKMVGRSAKLVDGCQDLHDAESCIKLIAIMHAKSWVGDKKPNFLDLDSCPGVGLALDGLAKERRFVSQHAKYLDLYASSASEENVIMDENAQARLRSLSKHLCQHRLREIHDQVVSYRPCLIHGDFHVGNLIFPQDDGNAPVLIDWATCGRGNPIFDLVFFLVVSTPRGGEDEDYTTELIKLYYRTLVDSNSSENSDLIRKDFPSYNGSFLSMYTNVVLNEFLILIAYDDLASQFVEAAEKPAVRAERRCHFGNVARRTMTALLNIEPTIEWPSLKSEDDMKEEEIALADDGGDDIKVVL